MINIEHLDPIPANDNPFKHDLYNMGTSLGTNCIVMHSNFSRDECPYLIVINKETGERVRLTLKGAK